jgi:hypothetical protein
MKRLALLVAVVALALAAAVPAYGQSAVSDAYGGKGGGIVGTVGGGGGGGTPTSTPQQTQVAASNAQGSLPFTGLDIGLLAVGGVALVGVGIGLRRFARPLS